MEAAASAALLAAADYLAGIEVSEGVYMMVPAAVLGLRQLEAALFD